MIRVNENNLEAVLKRKQPVSDDNLVWGCGYFTTWDGKNFQVVVKSIDADGNDVFQCDDEGNWFFAMEIDQPASAEAMDKYMDKHPAPESADD